MTPAYIAKTFAAVFLAAMIGVLIGETAMRAITAHVASQMEGL
jgi:hypothetical protein